MIKESEIKNKPLFIKDLITDFTIADIIYSTANFKLLGLQLTSPKKLNNKLIAPYKKVKSLTSEGIVITSQKELVYYHQIPEIELALSNPTKLIGIEVHSHSGDLLGTIVDTLINNQKGTIEGFLMSEGVLSDLMDGYCLIPATSIFDIIQGPVVLNQGLENIVIDRQGGLKKLLGIDLH